MGYVPAVAARGFLTSGGIDQFGASSIFSLLSPSHPSVPLHLEVGALEVGPLNPARESGECCRLPQWGLGEAPAANNFSAF